MRVFEDGMCWVLRNLGQQLQAGEGLRLLIDLHSELALPELSLPDQGLYITSVLAFWNESKGVGLDEVSKCGGGGGCGLNTARTFTSR